MRPAPGSRRSPKLGLRRTNKARPQVPITLTGVVPAHPATADHLDRVPTWNGDTNYNFGTCGPCSVANSAIMTWKYLAGVDISVTDQAIFDLYRASGNPDFDPATGAGDNGVDMTVMLSALVKQGLALTMPDGSVNVIKPLAYGQVQWPPYDDIHAVTAIFGGALGAFALDTSQQRQTDAHVWDYAPSAPWGGHACFCGAYTSATAAHQVDESLITWMERCGTTASFLNHQLEELYAVVWPPLWDSPDFIAGVDRAALAADFTAITGRPFPVPVPPPTPPPGPTPPPAPVPDAALHAYLTDPQMDKWAKRWSPTTAPGSTGYAKQQYRNLQTSEGGGA